MQQGVEVRTIEPRLLIQSIDLPKLKLICIGRYRVSIIVCYESISSCPQIDVFLIRFWYLRCCGCPWNRGRQHLATPLKTCQNIEAGFLTLPIPQLRCDGIWDSAVPALGLCACRCPRKRGIIRLATMTTLPEHQSVDDCRRSLLLPRLKQLVTLRREGYIRIYLLLDGLAWSG